MSEEPRTGDDPVGGGREAEQPTGSSAEEVPGSGFERVEEDFDALLEDVKRERDEYLDLARRAKADFENYRKRAAHQATDALKRGKAELARELLPAIDSLERAADSADEDHPLSRGVALVLDELLATLGRAGVESYDPAGERFDPAWHDALSTRPEEGVEAGVVLETLERGYRLDGQVLRAARVVVSE